MSLSQIETKLVIGQWQVQRSWPAVDVQRMRFGGMSTKSINLGLYLALGSCSRNAFAGDLSDGRLWVIAQRQLGVDRSSERL